MTSNWCQTELLFPNNFFINITETLRIVNNRIEIWYFLSRNKVKCLDTVVMATRIWQKRLPWHAYGLQFFNLVIFYDKWYHWILSWNFHTYFQRNGYMNMQNDGVSCNTYSIVYLKAKLMNLLWMRLSKYLWNLEAYRRW